MAVASSALLFVDFPITSVACKHPISSTTFSSNNAGLECASPSANLVRARNQGVLSPEPQSKSDSQTWCLNKTLARIACGVISAASVCWDLPFIPPPASAVTPFSEAAGGMRVGLVKGRIQACPLDINPNCVSTSSNNSGYAAPWIVPESSTSNAAKKIETAILSTQKNAAILHIEESPQGGTYLVAEADGFLGRDVMEFLVRKDVVTYRSMAKRVIYLYPFTTPIGDFDGQQRHLKVLEDELGWSVPSFENTFDQEY